MKEYVQLTLSDAELSLLMQMACLGAAMLDGADDAIQTIASLVIPRAGEWNSLNDKLVDAARRAFPKNAIHVDLTPP